MFVREAGVEDLPAILRMMRDFASSAGLRHLFPDSEDGFDNAVATVADLDCARIYLAVHEKKPVGIMIVTFLRTLWDPDKIEVNELVFWTDPDAPVMAALRLLRHVQTEARAVGAFACVMANLPSSPEHTAKAYKSMGFELTQRTYTKVF